MRWSIIHFLWSINSSVFLITFQFFPNFLTNLKFRFRKNLKAPIVELLIQSPEKISRVMRNFFKIHMDFEKSRNLLQVKKKTKLRNFLLNNYFLTRLSVTFRIVLIKLIFSEFCRIAKRNANFDWKYTYKNLKNRQKKHWFKTKSLQWLSNQFQL